MPPLRLALALACVLAGEREGKMEGEGAGRSPHAETLTGPPSLIT